MRILLKISGEAIMGKQEFGASHEALQNIAKTVAPLQKKGHQIGIVIGGGNIFRGLAVASSLGLERTPADQMGMLATMMNGILLSQALKSEGLNVTLMSALECPLIAETYNWKKATALLQEGQIILFVGGTGQPYFTTDTAAALRACEIKADLLLKATTRVDGIYDKDPLKHSDAKKFESLSYAEFVEKKLAVMDLTAITLCMTNKIPVRVCNLYQAPLLEMVEKSSFGSLIR